jgi:hypothetical protein
MRSDEQLRSSPSGGEVLLYEAPDGQVRVDVRLEKETVWLTQEQLSQLFGRERSVIIKHVRNVFREGELKPGLVCAKFAHTAADGKTYQVDHYNFDLIISVGYRVKSQRGVQFRQWATRVLREHLVQGYTFKQTRLAERGSAESPPDSGPSGAHSAKPVNGGPNRWRGAGPDCQLCGYLAASFRI